LLAFLITGTLLTAQEARVTPLMSKDLPKFSGMEGLMNHRGSPPRFGSDSSAQRACVPLRLEGSVVIQVKSGSGITLTPGQTFYEGPDDIHTVGRNASKTKPAKFIVFLE
jgi:hypothetical protein